MRTDAPKNLNTTSTFVQGLDAARAASEFGYLTPDMLLDYCRAKVRGLDEQIQRAFLKQQDRNRLSQALSGLMDQLSAFREHGIKDSDKASKDAVNGAYDRAIAAAGPNTELGTKLRAEKDAFNRTAGGTETKNAKESAAVSAEEMKAFSDTIQRAQSDANHEGELEMIKLQSLMSQRQQAFQLITNMVAALGETAKGIVAKVGV